MAFFIHKSNQRACAVRDQNSLLTPWSQGISSQVKEMRSRQTICPSPRNFIQVFHLYCLVCLCLNPALKNSYLSVVFKRHLILKELAILIKLNVSRAGGEDASFFCSMVTLWELFNFYFLTNGDKGDQFWRWFFY